MSLTATALILTGALLALKGLYLMAGDLEPDGTIRESIRHRKSKLGR